MEPNLSIALGGVATAGALAIANYVDDYYNSIVKQKLHICNQDVDYPDSLDMFNGLHQFSGDGVKYDAAMDWFLTYPVHLRWLVVVSCTIALEKPTGVIYSGIIGAQKAKFRAHYNRNKEAITSMSNILPTFASLWEKEKDAAAKDAILETTTTSIAAYLVTKTLKQEDDTVIQYLTIEAPADKLKIPVGFHKALIDTLAKKEAMIGAGSHFSQIDRDELDRIRVSAKNVHMDPVVARYLPKISLPEFQSRDEKDQEEMMESRALWHDDFKFINVSRAKVVAMLALQYQFPYYKIQKDWYDKYEKRPRHAVCPASVNSRTKDIWEKNMAKFKEDKKLYHKRAGIVFGGNWPLKAGKIPTTENSDDENSTANNAGVDASSGGGTDGGLFAGAQSGARTESI
jgi:hypothetical protein